jgi:hypothetical protein
LDGRSARPWQSSRKPLVSRTSPFVVRLTACLSDCCSAFSKCIIPDSGSCCPTRGMPVRSTTCQPDAFSRTESLDVRLASFLSEEVVAGSAKVLFGPRKPLRDRASTPSRVGTEPLFALWRFFMSVGCHELRFLLCDGGCECRHATLCHRKMCQCEECKHPSAKLYSDKSAASRT